ncbi:MAG: hypothetical protein WCT11_02690 [Candidatus Magasanikbacteria bacterium]
MHEPTFRQALSRSWQLVAQKKSLWIFGLLSALIGQMGLSDFVGMLYKTTNEGFRPYDFSLFFDFINSLNWHRVSVVLLALWLLGIILLLIMVIVFVSVSARGAIIAYAIHWYKKESIMPLSDAWNKGVQRFFPLLAISIVGRGLQMIFICLFSVVASRLVQGNTLSGSLWLIFSATVALCFILLIEAVSIFSSGYLMFEKKSLVKSVQKGWSLFLDHVLVSFELGVVLMLLSAILLGVIIYGSFVAFLPSLVMWLIAGLSGMNFLIGFGIYSGVVLYIALVLVLAGIFNAFVTCSWMYLFMKMHHEGVVSRVIHFFQHLFRRT